uniref:Uncharacterized protein n=1 Tax=Paraburkholderia sprentiae WSM5005 TaxID=754502 RepID=A0A1I9YWC6_9BURK
MKIFDNAHPDYQSDCAVGEKMKRSVRECDGEVQEKKGRSVARHIGILLFDGFSLLSTSAIAEMFQLANEIYRRRNHDHKPYNVTFYSARRKNSMFLIN